jgi:hypothetical protein
VSALRGRYGRHVVCCGFYMVTAWVMRAGYVAGVGTAAQAPDMIPSCWVLCWAAAVGTIYIPHYALYNGIHAFWKDAAGIAAAVSNVCAQLRLLLQAEHHPSRKRCAPS